MSGSAECRNAMHMLPIVAEIAMPQVRWCAWCDRIGHYEWACDGLHHYRVCHSCIRSSVNFRRCGGSNTGQQPFECDCAMLDDEPEEN